MYRDLVNLIGNLNLVYPSLEDIASARLDLLVVAQDIGKRLKAAQDAHHTYRNVDARNIIDMLMSEPEYTNENGEDISEF